MLISLSKKVFFIYEHGIFPRKPHVNPPPLKVTKLSFWLQRSAVFRNVRKKHSSDYFCFFKILILSFCDLRYFSTKHLVLLRFRSKLDLYTFQKILRKLKKYISLKKMTRIFFTTNFFKRIYFFNKYFLGFFFSEPYETHFYLVKSVQTIFCSKLKK